MGAICSDTNSTIANESKETEIKTFIGIEDNRNIGMAKKLFESEYSPLPSLPLPSLSETESLKLTSHLHLILN